MTVETNHKHLLLTLFQASVKRVNGQEAVESALRQLRIQQKVAVIAIGKAASAMMLGAQAVLSDKIDSALVITKIGHAHPGLQWPCIEAGHPVPNQQSLLAGERLIAFLRELPDDIEVIALISGGASSLVEVLPDYMALSDLQKINDWLLASGLDITEINKIRQSISLIKGGKALSYLNGQKITQLLISDVINDDAQIIGSGLFTQPSGSNDLHNADNLPGWLTAYIQDNVPQITYEVKSHIVASNELACQEVVKHASAMGYEVYYHGQSLFGDVFDIAIKINETLSISSKGIHVWGGETTVKLPENPGRGGRNQSLALALACKIKNQTGITILVGATDGSDGPTDDAGAIVDGLTLNRAGHLSADDYLAAADAGTFLAESGDLISTGPTGTNVMDIVIAIKDCN